MKAIVGNSYLIRMKYNPATKALTPEDWNEEVTAISEKAARRQFRKSKRLHPSEPLVCVANAPHHARAIASRHECGCSALSGGKDNG